MLCDYLCFDLALPKQKEMACYNPTATKITQELLARLLKINSTGAHARSQAVGNSGVNEALYCFYPEFTGANRVYIDKDHILACCKVQTVFAGRNSWQSFEDTRTDY